MNPEMRRRLREYPALAGAVLYHETNKGEKMSFKDKHFLLQLYMKINKRKYGKMVVEKSVQCGLSELFILNAHIEANSGMSVLFVFPKYELRDRVVSGRVKRLYNRNKFYMEKKRIARKLEGANRLSLSTFGDGIINFVGSNVESEFLEFPADSAYIDEKDRCDLVNLRLVPGRLTASRYKFQREISNPTVDNFGIDQRYRESTRGKWFIKCSCGHWFTPELFTHLVREVLDNEFQVRDSDYVDHQVAPYLICDKCHAKVDRLSKGEWINEFEDREYQGFRISQLFSPTVDLGDLLWEKENGFFDSMNSLLGKRVFFNNRMGLPYSDSDSKISEASLDLCQRDFPYPFRSQNKRSVFIGVDVGSILNVIIRERTFEGKEETFRLCEAHALRSFEELSRLLTDYPCHFCVVDALPEGHEVKRLKDKFNFVFSCLFVDSALSILTDKKKRVIRINRTVLVDAVKESIDSVRLYLPMDAKIRIPSYYAHLTAPNRILEINETRPDRSQYIWANTTPDHYFFAEAYCRAASMLSPRKDVFDHFEGINKRAEEIKTKDKSIPIPTNKQKMSPEEYLSDMNRRNLQRLRDERKTIAKR